jgi:hypothetical protein
VSTWAKVQWVFPSVRTSYYRPVITLRQHATVLLGIGSLVVAVGCDKRMCRPGMETHGRYRVDVVSNYDEQSAFTFKRELARSNGFAEGNRCPAGSDGIVAGTAIRLEGIGGVDNDQDNCTLVAAKVVAGPPQITLRGRSSDTITIDQVHTGDPLLYAAEDVTIGSCSGTVGFAVVPTGTPAGYFATPAAGQLPHALLYRLFVAKTSGCQPCDGNFVVHLVRE